MSGARVGLPKPARPDHSLEGRFHGQDAFKWPSEGYAVPALLAKNERPHGLMDITIEGSPCGKGFRV